MLRDRAMARQRGLPGYRHKLLAVKGTRPQSFQFLSFKILKWQADVASSSHERSGAQEEEGLLEATFPKGSSIVGLWDRPPYWPPTVGL